MRYGQLLQAVTSFASCYKLLSGLTAVTSCRQLRQLLQAVTSLDSCYKLSTAVTAITHNNSHTVVQVLLGSLVVCPSPAANTYPLARNQVYTG